MITIFRSLRYLSYAMVLAMFLFGSRRGPYENEFRSFFDLTSEQMDMYGLPFAVSALALLFLSVSAENLTRFYMRRSSKTERVQK